MEDTARSEKLGAPQARDPHGRLRGLLTRAVTAAVLIPLALGIVMLGGRVYAGVVAAMVIFLIFEWTRMVDGAEFSRGFYTLSVTSIGAMILAASGRYEAAILAGLGGGLLATLFERRGRPPASWPFVGAVYLVLPAIAALYVRLDPAGGAGATILLFTVVWATDSGAYLVGTFLGGPRLWPALSPKKTWSGALGGVVAGAGTAGVLCALLDLPFGPIWGLGLGVLLAVSAIGGDLIESALKRSFNVKDTGGAFPGHGGVLDRLDGFIVAAVALALLLGLGQNAGS